MALLSATRALLVPGTIEHADRLRLTERERRWWKVTELPFLVAALAVLVWLPPQRPLDVLVCLLLLLAYAISTNVLIAIGQHGNAASVQLVLVPMLFLAPLNLVPLLVLGGNMFELAVQRRPIGRWVLALGNSVYALAPVLVLGVAAPGAFGWEHWPVYVAALGAQLAGNALFSLVRLRLTEGDLGDPREVLGAPAVIDSVLSLPALAVVAIALDAPVAASLTLVALLVIAGGFTSEHRARLLERERAAEHARRAIFEERVGIARELHDVVAHHVSMMGVQAGAARVVLDRDPQAAKQALGMIEASSRQAVLELHQLLGFLRQAGDSDAAAGQPGLVKLDDLVAAMCGSRLAVAVRVEGEPRALAPTLDASAFRIVQEALTNALKHADASRVDVHLRYRSDALEIEVVDDGRANGGPPPRRSSPGGLGLIGMRERAVLHGGDLEAGPVAGGGFAVRATLPTIAGAP
jgi:signal transduction histidine kinase